MARIPDAGDVYTAGQNTAPTPVASAVAPPQAPPPPAPASPAPAGAITGSPIPGAGIYAARQADAQRAWDNAMQQIQNRQNQLYNEFGFLNDGSVDPHSQFGRFQMMQRQQATESDDAIYRSHGRGFTGGLVNADLANAEIPHGAQRFGLSSELARNLTGFNEQRAQAGITRGESMTNALQEQATNALNAQNFTPVAPAEVASPAAPAAPAAAAAPAPNYSLNLPAPPTALQIQMAKKYPSTAATLYTK